MRNHFERARRRKGLNFFTVLLASLFILSCAKDGVHKPRGRHDEAPPERETKEAPARTMNPSQRRASQTLVDKGLMEYRAGELDQAMHYFQDAITVDGQNGAAYYYAAQVCLEEDNTADAAGFLDKAEVLFSDDEEWLEKIAKLRELMEQE